MVSLPQHEICLKGNLFGCPFGHFPNLITIRRDRYWDALTCAAAAQTVLDLDASMILYAHHGPVVGKELIREELTAYRDAILYVHDESVEVDTSRGRRRPSCVSGQRAPSGAFNRPESRVDGRAVQTYRLNHFV